MVSTNDACVVALTKKIGANMEMKSLVNANNVSFDNDRLEIQETRTNNHAMQVCGFKPLDDALSSLLIQTIPFYAFHGMSTHIYSFHIV